MVTTAIIFVRRNFMSLVFKIERNQIIKAFHKAVTAEFTASFNNYSEIKKGDEVEFIERARSDISISDVVQSKFNSTVKA